PVPRLEPRRLERLGVRPGHRLVLRPALLAHTRLHAVLHAIGHAGRLAAVLAHEHHVRQIDEQLGVDDAALLQLLAAGRTLALRPRVLLGPGHAVDQDAALLGEHPDDPALASLVLARDDPDLVVLVDRHTRHRYSTSGANEMIFMNRLSRSSRATGPKMRVPRGFRCSLISTTALSSKRM